MLLERTTPARPIVLRAHAPFPPARFVLGRLYTEPAFDEEVPVSVAPSHVGFGVIDMFGEVEDYHVPAIASTYGHKTAEHRLADAYRDVTKRQRYKNDCYRANILDRFKEDLKSELDTAKRQGKMALKVIKWRFTDMPNGTVEVRATNGHQVCLLPNGVARQEFERYYNAMLLAHSQPTTTAPAENK